MNRRTMRPRAPAVRGLPAAVMALSLVPVTAFAQGTEPPLRRPEAAVAIGWLGGAGFGAADANLRTRTGDDYRLFSTESRMSPAPAIEARAAYALTRRYSVEARFSFSRPDLRTDISDDVEGAPALDVAERIDQYTIDGALVVMLPGLRFSSLVPFVSGGAGYLRQLHEGQTQVEEGIAYHVGGGVRRSFFAREQGFLKAAGFRADLRAQILTGGVDLGDSARIHVAALGGVFVGF